MARTDHSRKRTAPRRVGTEGTTRTQLRTMLAAGEWENIPTRQSGRTDRRAW